MTRIILPLLLASIALAKPACALQTVTALGCYSAGTISSATALPTIPTGATAIVITVLGQPVNYRDDGTNPTAAATGGVQFPIGTSYYAGPLSALKLIQTTATSTAFYCAYK